MLWPAAMCQEDSEEHQNTRNEKSLHRKFLSQPPGHRGLFLSLPHSTTQLVHRLLCTCSLWLRDCPDQAGGTNSACTGVIGNGEEHSMNCSWVLETIPTKSLYTSYNSTCWNKNSFEDQWLLKIHSEKRGAYALLHSSLPVFLNCSKGSFKSKGRCQCFPYGDTLMPLPKEMVWIYVMILQRPRKWKAQFSIISPL